MRKNANRGFTLLEAIVSIVLFSTVGLAIFSAINTGLISLTRAQAHTRTASLTNNAIEILKQVNPMMDADGETEMGELTLEWQSTLLEPERDGVGYPGGTGYYQIGLYTIHATIKEKNHTLVSFDLRAIGSKQVRFWESPF
jgi:general secretion pathway protein I